MSETTKKASTDVINALQFWAIGVEVVDTPTNNTQVVITCDGWAGAKLLAKYIVKCINGYWSDELEAANVAKHKAIEKIHTIQSGSLSVLADIEKHEKPDSEKPKEEAKSEEEECF